MMFHSGSSVVAGVVTTLTVLCALQLFPSFGENSSHLVEAKIEIKFHIPLPSLEVKGSERGNNRGNGGAIGPGGSSINIDSGAGPVGPVDDNRNNNDRYNGDNRDQNRNRPSIRNEEGNNNSNNNNNNGDNRRPDSRPSDQPRRDDDRRRDDSNRRQDPVDPRRGSDQGRERNDSRQRGAAAPQNVIVQVGHLEDQSSLNMF